MQITSGVRIYFDDSSDIPALGIVSGVGMYKEDDSFFTAGLSNLLLGDWDSGCSEKVDIQTNPKSQTTRAGSIKLNNHSGFYQSVIDAGLDFRGKRIERVHWTLEGVIEGLEYISVNTIKDISVNESVITLTLASLDDQMNGEISKPIDGDKYYPVVFGDHDKGVMVSNGIKFTPVNDLHSWGMICLDSASINIEGLNSTYIQSGKMYLEFVPEDTSVDGFDYQEESYSGMYFKCEDGGMSGKSIRVGDLSQSTSGDLHTTTLDAIYHNSSGEGAIKGANPITSETSVGTLGSYGTEFYGDGLAIDYSGSIKNKDGEDIASDSLVISGTKAILDAPLISDDKIVGYPIKEITEIDYAFVIPSLLGYISDDQPWTNLGDGFWVGSNDNNDTNTPNLVSKSGSFSNIIDANKNTDYTVSAQYLSSGGTGVSGRFTAVQMFYVDYVDNIHALLADIEIRLRPEFNTVDSDYALSIGGNISVNAYWETTSGYPDISNPVQSLAFDSYDFSRFTREQKKINFKDYVDSYYQDTGMPSNFGRNSWFECNQGGWLILSDFFVEAFARGGDNFTLDTSSFNTAKKKPSGYIVSVQVDYGFGGTPAPSMDFDVTLEIKTKSLAWYQEETTVSPEEFVTSKTTGRPYTTFATAQDHLLRLMNWEVLGKTKPADGWGLAPCVDADISDTANNAIVVKSQFFDKNDLTSKWQLEKIMVESWNMIFRSKDATMIIASSVDKLGASTTSNYSCPSQCNRISVDVFDHENTYNTFTVQYDYNVQTGSYNKSISITNTGQTAYDASYVTGVCCPAVAEPLWNWSREIYRVAQAERKLPDTLSKLRWITEEADAITYIQNCLQWYGIKAGVYVETKTVKMDHPIEDYYSNEKGDSIGYDIPNVTGGTFWTGVVIGMEYIPETKRCNITSILRAEITVGRIIELETNTDRDIELETNTDRIIEVVA